MNRERYYPVVAQPRPLGYHTCGFRASDRANPRNLTTGVLQNEFVGHTAQEVLLLPWRTSQES